MKHRKYVTVWDPRGKPARWRVGAFKPHDDGGAYVVLWSAPWGCGPGGWIRHGLAFALSLGTTRDFGNHHQSVRCGESLSVTIDGRRRLDDTPHDDADSDLQHLRVRARRWLQRREARRP